MKESIAIIDVLKKQLRAQKITYEDVAEALELSEASVKRLFSKGGFTLERLEQICELAGLKVSELAAMAEQKPADITRLTADQERHLVSDPKLLLVAMLSLNDWRLEDILRYYQLDESEVVARLLTLDRLGMIELLPGNRVRRLVARNFSWQPLGPVQRYIHQELKGDFLESTFTEPDDHLRFLGALISREHITRMHRAIDQLVRELDSYAQQDSDLPLEEKVGIAAVFALRPWEVPAFREFRRPDSPR